MLGKFIVRYINDGLNMMGILILIAGSVLGSIYGYIFTKSIFCLIIGFPIGFLIAFVIVVSTFGIAFLFLEINNNLLELNKNILDINATLKLSDRNRTLSEKAVALNAVKQRNQAGLLETERTCAGCGNIYNPKDYQHFMEDKLWLCSCCMRPLPKE